jgi:hypothetical protein
MNILLSASCFILKLRADINFSKLLDTEFVTIKTALKFD